MVNEISGWWFQTFYFPYHIWDVILPIDELIFFRGVQTTNQILLTIINHIITIDINHY